MTVINFWRLYGRIFYTIDNCKIKRVAFANTHYNYASRMEDTPYIPSDVCLTDRQAREWFKEHYPDYEINKVNKHWHQTLRNRDGERTGD